MMITSLLVLLENIVVYYGCILLYFIVLYFIIVVFYIVVFYRLGIKDNLTGQYIINLPSRSRTVYYKGTRIEYVHNNNQDSIALDGPTKVPFRVLVRVPSTNDYRLEISNILY